MGVADYWQATFLVLGVLIILMNICLMFVHEPIDNSRQNNQKVADVLNRLNGLTRDLQAIENELKALKGESNE